MKLLGHARGENYHDFGFVGKGLLVCALSSVQTHRQNFGRSSLGFFAQPPPDFAPQS
jgi:hypothetical protein